MSGFNLSDAEINEISNGVLYNNIFAKGNKKAKAELIGLIDSVSKKPLKTVNEYIDFCDNHIYTYRTWEDLVESEKEQMGYGLTEEELKEEFESKKGYIWQLSCGWFVQ